MENNMKLASELYNKAASFKQDENGTILPLTAIILTGLVLASGAAIDYSRYSSAKNVMNTALDAAILDAGIRLGEGQPVDQKFEDDFNAFFNVNITGRGGFTDNYTIVDFSADPDTGKVSATANASVDTTLMRIAGIDEMNISTESAGIFEQTDNEVTIMLDVTG
jgi:Flp pilus assembly protein TadG